MTTLSGRYYDGRSAAGRDVVVSLSVRGSLSFDDGDRRRRFALSELAISARLVNQPAIVDMPDGGRLEIADADTFFGTIAVPDSPGMDWEHRLEAYWSRILAAIIVAGALVWIGVEYGVPLAARAAAALTPVEFDDEIGARGLEMLDSAMLSPTALAAGRRRELRDAFADVVATVGDEHRYRLEFRLGNRLGPNAIALPSGIVIMTDELVALSEHDEELVAVLAHEVGHARHRHALRALIQNSLIAGMALLLLGDPGAATTIAAGIPTLLIERSYSREFEREADDVAFEYLKIRAIPDSRFTDLLRRLADHVADTDAPSLLSTHPRAGERVRRRQPAGAI
ncbi:MAG: M48 family metallopeptidase [Gammaproteobacteria bacterium]